LAPAKRTGFLSVAQVTSDACERCHMWPAELTQSQQIDRRSAKGDDRQGMIIRGAI
jgi:hypothetical protein